MVRRGLAVAAVATLAQLLGYGDAEAAAPRLSISTQATVVGDGRSTIDVVVSISPAASVSDISALELKASAGTLLDPTPRGESAVVYRFHPPRVVAPVTVAFEASAKHRRRIIRAQATLAVSAHVIAPGTQTGHGGLGLVGPDHMVLGQHERAEIALDGATAPRLVTNSGSISPPIRGADGRWRSTFTPAASRAPRIAIVAAVSDRELDWLAIPLHGRGRLTVTSERGASIELDVGGHRFGPIRADRRGRTSIAITVPPGLPAATSIASDELGNKSRSSLPLDPPPFNRLLALCPERTGPVRALVVDLMGKPAARADLRGTANVGTLDTFEAVSAGVFAAPIAVTAAPSTGRLEIDLQLASEAASRSTCSGEVPRAAPIGVVVEEVRPMSHRAGGEAAELAVRMSYPDRSLPLSWPISLSADAGVVSKAEETGPGRYRATWTPPRKIGGKQRVTITATLVNSEVAPATMILRLEPGPPERLVASAPREVRADGRTTGVADVVVTDRFGNPTGVSELRLEVSGGRFALAEARTGSYRGTFVIPRATSNGTLVGRVTAGELSAPISIRFRGVRPRLAVSLRGGYLTNFNRVGGAAGSLALDYFLPVAGGDRITVGADVGLGLSDRSEGGADPLEVGVRTISTLARAAVWVPIGRASLYGGGTGGLASSRVTIESASTGRTVSWNRAPVVGGFAGAELAVGFGRLIVEAAYQHARIDGASVEGNVLGLIATAGFRVGFY